MAVTSARDRQCGGVTAPPRLPTPLPIHEAAAFEGVLPQRILVGQRKLQRLVRPWPLLSDEQDPDSLEARVAFHLHRTGFIGARLSSSSFLSRPHLQDLTQGRLPLTTSDILRLARELNLYPRELLRPLTRVEADIWSFYRGSARHRHYVWKRARACWEVAGISVRLAASIMTVPHPNVVYALRSGPHGRVLTFEQALRLTTALKMSAGPAALLMFVDQLQPPEHNIADIVSPLTDYDIELLKVLHLRSHERRRIRRGEGR